MFIEELSETQLDSFQNSDARLNIFEGPVRAGKSFISLLRWLEFCRSGPPGPLLLCGRTDKTIKRNLILPLQELVGNAISYSIGKGEVTLYNRLMYVVGANDERAEGKIRGSEFAGALIDEATLIPESFFKMLLSRLSVEGAQLFASTNPDSPYHWLKRDYIDRQNELNLKVFSFNIRDNPSLSEKYINELSKEYQGLWFKRYIESQWVLADGAVYDFFDEEIHVINMPSSVADYYIVGIDYGTTNPCVFTLIGYNPGGYPNIWLEKEYYFDSKKELRQKSDYEYTKDLQEFITGYNVKRIYLDPSAASFRQELRRNGVNNVADALNDVLPGIRFVGQLLTNGTYKICMNCTNTLKEFTNYLWDSKASERGEDKPIKMNDHCFVADTMITTLKGKKRIQLIEKGEKVLTRTGYKKVKELLENERECSDFVLLGNKVSCTPDHKFFTINEGWKEISSLIHSDILIVNLEILPWLKSSSLMESNIDAIQILKLLVIESTIEHINQTPLKDMDIFIETFGNSIMEKFQKDTIFITKTEIPSTMTLAISSLSHLKTTFPIMEEILLTIKEEIEKKTAIGLEKKPQNGIEVKKEENGTKNMQKKHGVLLKESLNVFNVGSLISQLKDPFQNSVAINVKANGEEIISVIMKKEDVLNVMSSSFQPNTEKQNSAPKLALEKPIGRRKVYNLHVEDEHEYVAQGFLVKNSMDAQRYALYTHFFNKKMGPSMTEEDARLLEEMYA